MNPFAQTDIENSKKLFQNDMDKSVVSENRRRTAIEGDCVRL